MTRRTKKQYKIWIHIETWIGGEPIEGDEDPHCVDIPYSADNLVDVRERAEGIRMECCEILSDRRNK